MLHSLAAAAAHNFLGDTPRWYKATIAAILVANPLILLAAGPVVVGWLVVAEFVFALAMSLKCYPLLPGGLIAIESVVIGLTTPGSVYAETRTNLPVILLLMFMVAGIYFMRDSLLFVFTKLFLAIRSKLLLSLTFAGAAAALSAFLDALTVLAVIIAVAAGLYSVYHQFSSQARDGHPHKEDLSQFRAFLRSIMMHAAVGTALGGVTTEVGEPQNLLIGDLAGWSFGEFFVRVAPVSIPVLVVGLLTTVLLEVTGAFGYGAKLPDSVRDVLARWAREQTEHRDDRDRMRFIVHAITALFLVVALILHLAEVGLIGLTVIVLATAFTGVVSENSIGHAFEDALPFTALLVVFFAIVAVIHDQGLFTPIIDLVLAQSGGAQLTLLFVASGLLSMISDNVFVATVYITGVESAFQNGMIDQEQFNLLAVAVNTGTNIPSVATPNGQAAFLFLLTSGLAPLIRLGYLRMLVMALPYTITMTTTGLLAVAFFLA